MTAAPNLSDDTPRYMSEAAYLAFERESLQKHEYIAGEVVAMTGGSPAHSTIATYTSHALITLLDERPCTVYNGDMRVYIESSQLYTYPDLSIICGDPTFTEDGHSLLNPQLLVEVLSPSTEAYDRGTKFRAYKQLPSLQEYVLIAQDEPRMECFTRRNDPEWLYRDIIGLDSSIQLHSLDVTLLLADVYQKVTFEYDAR